MNEKIAIVVPVYKVEKYIRRCVDSLIAQKYENLEIILVDDGSPDCCPQICDEYASKDNRIKVIHKKNGGLSDARNAGVRNATSEYVVFVDSDDYVDDTLISSLVGLKSKYGVDISCTPLIYEFERGTQKPVAIFEETKLEGKAFISQVMRARYGIGVSVCSKLFPRSVLLAHPFPIGKLHEDIAIAIQLYSEFNTAAINNKAAYHYIQRTSSITHSTIDESSLFWILDLIKSLLDKETDKALREAFVYRIYDLVNEYCRVIHVHEDKAIICKMQEYIRPYRSIYIRDSLNSSMTKLKGYLLSTNYITFRMFIMLKTFNNKVHKYV